VSLVRRHHGDILVLLDSDIGRWSYASGPSFPDSSLPPPHDGAVFLRSDLGSHYSWSETNRTWTIIGGAADLTYDPDPPDSVATTITEKLSEEVSVFDYLTAEQKADVRSGAATLDVTARVQLALDAGAGKRVKFPAGTYLVYALKVSAGTVVDLDDAAVIKKRPVVSGDQSVATFTGSAVFSGSSRYAPIFWITGNDVTIRGGTIDGNRANDTFDLLPPWGAAFNNDSNRAGILASTSAIPSVTDITIDNVHFVNMVGVAICLELAGTVRITNCREANAGNMFAGVTGDVTTLLTKGTLVVSGNLLAGDRFHNHNLNVGVFDRKETVIFTENVVDGPTAFDAIGGAVKFQQLYDAIISKNTFTSVYITPQSTADFYGDSFEIIGNTFISLTPTTNKTGIQFGLHRMKALTVSGNSIINGGIVVERSSDLVTVIGNTIKITTDSRFNAATNFWAISGGANQNSGIAGTVLITNNIVDLGGLANHSFFETRGGTGNNLGNVELRGNTVRGADAVWYFEPAADSSAARIKIVSNTFRFFRALGRINPDGLAELIVKDNQFTNIDTAPPSNISNNANRHMYVTPNAGTYGTFSFEGNIIAAREVDWRLASIEIVAQTIGTVSIVNNIFDNIESVSGQSLRVTATSGTITNLWVKNNIAAGTLSIGGTHTNEYVEGNTPILTHEAASDPHPGYQRESEKNAASGYAGLDGSTKLAGTQQTYGAIANTACEGNDSRLSDARTPTAHATSHQDGGSDEISVTGLSGVLASGQLMSIQDEGANVGTRALLNFAGAGVSVADDPGNGKVTVTIPGGGGTTPTGTGFRHVTAGVEDAASKLVENADVHATAAIAESKLSLNFATHSNANDPSAGQKSALAGTSGTPGVGNEYVTDDDPRNTNSRTPTAHATSHQNGSGDEISVTDLSGLLADAQKVTVRKNSGADVGTRKRLNLIEGTNVTLTVADDGTDDEVDVTIGASGASGASLTRIAGNSGAIGSDITWLRLTADSALVTVVSPGTAVITLTGVGAGDYLLRATLLYHCAVAGSGMGFGINHTGTVTRFVANWRFVSTGGAAATGVADSAAATVAGQLVEGKSGRTLNAVIGSVGAGVDTINTDIMADLLVTLTVTVSGDLEIKIMTETAGDGVRLKAPSFVELMKFS
jgi:hypothetical protein